MSSSPVEEDSDNVNIISVLFFNRELQNKSPPGISSATSSTAVSSVNWLYMTFSLAPEPVLSQGRLQIGCYRDLNKSFPVVFLNGGFHLFGYDSSEKSFPALRTDTRRDFFEKVQFIFPPKINLNLAVFHFPAAVRTISEFMFSHLLSPFSGIYPLLCFGNIYGNYTCPFIGQQSAYDMNIFVIRTTHYQTTMSSGVFRIIFNNFPIKNNLFDVFNAYFFFVSFFLGMQANFISIFSDTSLQLANFHKDSGFILSIDYFNVKRITFFLRGVKGVICIVKIQNLKGKRENQSSPIGVDSSSVHNKFFLQHSDIAGLLRVSSPAAVKFVDIEVGTNGLLGGVSVKDTLGWIEICKKNEEIFCSNSYEVCGGIIGTCMAGFMKSLAIYKRESGEVSPLTFNIIMPLSWPKLNYGFNSRLFPRGLSFYFEEEGCSFKLEGYIFKSLARNLQFGKGKNSAQKNSCREIKENRDEIRRLTVEWFEKNKVDSPVLSSSPVSGENEKKERPPLVIVLCKQGMERSKKAAFLIEQNLPDDLKGKVKVIARGEEPVSKDDIAVVERLLKDRGIFEEELKPVQAREEEYQEAGLVLVMSQRQLGRLCDKYPYLSNKISLLIPGIDLGIEPIDYQEIKGKGYSHIEKVIMDEMDSIIHRISMAYKEQCSSAVTKDSLFKK